MRPITRIRSSSWSSIVTLEGLRKISMSKARALTLSDRRLTSLTLTSISTLRSRHPQQRAQLKSLVSLSTYVVVPLISLSHPTRSWVKASLMVFQWPHAAITLATRRPTSTFLSSAKSSASLTVNSTSLSNAPAGPSLPFSYSHQRGELASNSSDC